MTDKRSFLLLQGPIGPFFKELGTALQARGHVVRKINFWGGDAAYYPDGVGFTQSLAEWSRYFMGFVKTHKVTDLVLFGDRRPYHERAIDACLALDRNIRVWVFEEGYFRPHWVTLERCGVNALSNVPLEAPVQAPVEPEHLVAPWVRRATPEVLRYYAHGLATRLAYPNFEYHRTQPPLAEAFLWGLRWAAGRLSMTDDELTAGILPDKRYFVAAIQLENDYQFRKYSPFPSMEEYITDVAWSFAQNAAIDDKLVFKGHPMDIGWFKRKRLVRRIAFELGLSDRILYIDQCNTPRLLSKARGVVTINSTLGLQALEAGVPVCTLGEAFWSGPGVTFDGGMDRFWADPQPVPGEAFEVLRGKIMATQFNGAFYTPEGRAALIRSVPDFLSSAEQSPERLATVVKARASDAAKVLVADTAPRRARRKVDIRA